MFGSQDMTEPKPKPSSSGSTRKMANAAQPLTAAERAQRSVFGTVESLIPFKYQITFLYNLVNK